ncbi:MaoC family dehydratase [Actibacterium sp. XHP0104]|uniref:MaoC family dehydratase n=1 Tax=Actibacterium sp. XHP0104 TaxID=2984335 RepID=UPI0021E997A5|nr:MaoC/PaaZ C-terminal domain-containing protein [Actibacterium sp. XHP0104]MCV2882532.1 MaoC/PaaZ C-terminal domain-containing protein [Actibacterium sp. XHP0104]
MDVREIWTPSQDEFDAFAQVSGDDNPIHVDPVFSSETTFGRTVSHGMLIYTKLWGLILRSRPGTRQISQEMMFPNPTFAGEPVELSISGKAPGMLHVCAARVADGAELLIGRAEVE